MRRPRPNSRQIISAWLTGAALVGAIWLQFAGWSARRTSAIETELSFAQTAGQSLAIAPGDPRFKQFHDSMLAFSMAAQNRALAASSQYRSDRAIVRPLVLAAGFSVLATLLFLTWSWATPRS